MGQTEPSRVPDRRPQKPVGFSKFLYNSENGLCLGRGCASWARIIVFYIILYSILAGFFAGLLFAFFEFVPQNVPALTIADGQPILLTPGISVLPIGDTREQVPLVSFNMSDPDTYATYVTQLRHYLDHNDNTTTTLDTCDGHPLVDSCPLELNRLSDCWDATDPNFKFGYDQGKPCFLMRLNKIYNWIPVPHTASPDNVTIGDRWSANNLPITCESFKAKKSSVDANLGNVNYFPAAGFPTSCYPFCGSSVPYTSAIAMVKFNNLTRGSDTAVWCKVHAQNVPHDRKQGLGSASFRILLED